MRRLLEESAPVAVILAFWAVLASVVPNTPSETGLLLAGVAMALLYVVSRGFALRGAYGQSERPTDWEETLRENVRVALPAGVWFLAGFLVVRVFRQLRWWTFHITGWHVEIAPEQIFAFAFSGAGVAAVLLYAIAIGLPDGRDDAPTGEAATGTGAED